VLFDLDLDTGGKSGVRRIGSRHPGDFVPHENYYPRFGWFPTVVMSQSGQSKLFNIDMQMGAAREIPFQ